jgi:hypothetical protein
MTPGIPASKRLRQLCYPSESLRRSVRPAAGDRVRLQRKPIATEGD